MALTRNDIRELRLWPHQVGAIHLIARYLSEASPDERTAALVNIPTGGGKSAVVSVAVHRRGAPRRVLVLTPRTSLRRQLAADLLGRRGLLHARLGSQGKLRTVREAASALQLRDWHDKADVTVATIQLLTKVFANDQDLFRSLQQQFAAVFVDEGHYEPAAGWSEAIRNLRRPTVLLTATPYRNDFRDFEINSDAIHVTTHQDLVARRFLRPLRVVVCDPADSATPERFLQATFHEFARQFRTPPTADRRLIIRCASREQIEEIEQAIRREGRFQCVAVHERFSDHNGAASRFKHPPAPESNQAPIWIHQYKLLEGIDDPSFCCVAIYRPLVSARALVQQVGRTLRNPRRLQRDHALLLDFSGGSQRRKWDRFLEYDSGLTQNSLLEGLAEIAAAAESLSPPTIYADGEFRSKLELPHEDAAAVRDSLRVPFRCCLLRARQANPILTLADLAVFRFKQEDAQCRIITLQDDHEALLLAAQTGTSPYLAEHFFVERKLQVFYALQDGDIIAVLDTSRAGQPQEVLSKVGKPIPRTELIRALSQAGSLHFTEITAKNTVLGKNVVRGKTLSGDSLSEISPSIDDMQFAPSSVVTTDRTPSTNRAYAFRSLGFGNARVSDSQPLGSLGDWADWARGIIASTRRVAAAPSYFRRFAQALSAPPTRSAAQSILLDVAALKESFELVHPVTGTVTAIDIPDGCFELDPGASTPTRSDFRRGALANGLQLDGGVSFDTDTERYVVVSKLLSNFRGKHRALGDLASYLNASQNFSVIPEEPSTVYCDGTFFDPKLNLGASFDPSSIGLDGILVDVPTLAATNSEKGAAQSALPTGWAANSVFAWIDANAGTLVSNPQLVVCDDGTNEACDFLIVGGTRAEPVVAMVHAKAMATRAFTGASNLQEVCGQAVKQLGMLNAFSPKKPTQVRHWRGNWSGPSSEGTVDARIRLDQGPWSCLTANQIWTELERLLRSHATRREVIIVVGATLNEQRLYTSARSRNVKAHVVHTLNLLRSTASSVTATGAALKIYCG